jgi:Pyruvate/2-oxoacid:ferredoxin oxidoreductase delta subunit
LQDLLHRIPGPKIYLPRYFRYGKYAALVLLVFALPYLLGFEVAGYLSLDKPMVNKGADGNIDVLVTVTNPGTEPVKNPQLDVTYESASQPKQEVYRQRKDFWGVVIPPGQAMVLPTFQVPNHLNEADLLVDSPQATVTQNPRYQLYFCKLCPNGTLTATIPSYFTKPSGKSMYQRVAGRGVGLGILAVFLVLMWLSSRPFCRLFCPLGAIYALTARLSVVGMKINRQQCIDCELCDKVCPMDLDVRNEIGGMECIACGDCMKVCPKSGISRTFTLLKPPASASTPA